MITPKIQKAAAIQIIEETIEKSKKEFISVLRNGGIILMPKEIAGYLRRGDCTISEAYQMRNEMYPILMFEKQILTAKVIKEALKYCLPVSKLIPDKK